MAVNWAAFLQEVTAICVTTLTDVRPNGIYMSSEIERISWEAIDGYPYLVVHLRPIETGDYGIGNIAYEPVVEFHYITAETQAQGADPLAALNVIPAKLEALKNALYAGSYATSQATVYQVESLDWGPETTLNSILLGKNVPVGGGMLAIRYICGETAFV